MKKNFFATDSLLVMLLAVCMVLGVALAVANPAWLWLVVVLIALVVLAVFLSLNRIRRLVRRILTGRAKDDVGKILSEAMLPLMAFSGKEIIWCNEAFRDAIGNGDDGFSLPVTKYVPSLDKDAVCTAKGQDISIGKKRYTVFGSNLQSNEDVYILIFVEDTLMKTQAEEYLASRPAVLYFTVDTYDEVLKGMQESERAKILSEIDFALETFVAKSSGFLRRVSTARYMAVVEERHIQKMMESRFDILDKVRKVDSVGSLVTMSIGVGRGAASLHECETLASQALDMALGRGGDQVAVKSPDGYEFYGGVMRSVEKRTRVKSRLMAKAMKDLMHQYDRVLIMGHQNSDMDSVGAMVGMWRFCRMCNVAAAMVIDKKKTMAGSLVDMLLENGYDEDILMPQEALALVGSTTLVVIVDTHIHYLLESEQIYRSCGGVIVIDHHRKMVGHIDNATIFYHEPYASSASELVSELLQYVDGEKDEKLTAIEAQALLAGIMLDTRIFSLHVGVRTFEAAAWLRRFGAQTSETKKLFSTSMNEYMYRSHLVSEAKIYEGCAVTLSDKVPFSCDVVAPQAANELLGITGVLASFVGIEEDGAVRISARSMGEVNVQLVMEKIGGGGHLTMAGTQLNNVSLEKAEEMLQGAITDYMEEKTEKPEENQKMAKVKGGV